MYDQQYTLTVSSGGYVRSYKPGNRSVSILPPQNLESLINVHLHTQQQREPHQRERHHMCLTHITRPLMPPWVPTGTCKRGFQGIIELQNHCQLIPTSLLPNTKCLLYNLASPQYIKPNTLHYYHASELSNNV